MSEYSRPRRIEPTDAVADFDCEVPILNAWLTEHALDSDRAGISRVFVTISDDRVVGYYGLANSTIAHEQGIQRVARGMPRHPIPAALITRLGVTKEHNRRGLGKHLVRDAMVRVVTAADQVGIRALHAHAKSDEARDFYLGLGFEESPVDRLHVQISLKHVRTAIAKAQGNG